MLEAIDAELTRLAAVAPPARLRPGCCLIKYTYQAICEPVGITRSVARLAFPKRIACKQPQKAKKERSKD